MSIPGLLQIAIYVVLLFAITKPVGLLLFHVSAPSVRASHQ